MRSIVQSKRCRSFLIFFTLSSLVLQGDELTIDPPTIWNVTCNSCIPYETLSTLECDDRIVVDLIDPLYEDGVLSTECGGVITAEDFRIQAHNITYIRQLDGDSPCWSIFCEGNLLVDYQDWVIVGDTMYYDFLTRTGYILNGKTGSPPWYIGGERIDFQENGDLVVSGGYLTTSEGENHDVQILASQITLSRNQVLIADRVSFKVNDISLFWLPHLKLSLKSFDRPPFGVRFGWGGFQGSHLSLLYRFLSWNDFQATARLDAFFTQGFGAGIDTIYRPKWRCTEWYSRNYYAHDIAIDDPHRRDRYRFEGTFFDRVFDDSVTINGVYDFVSDAQMAADYRTRDFDLKTAGRTEIEVRKETNHWIANLFARVKVNSFQTVNQELPSFEFNWHPFEIPGTGIIAENTFKASYLDYAYGDDRIIFNDVDPTSPSNFHSGRFSTFPRIYRPIPFGPLIVTPEAGFVGIYYTNSPGDATAGQAVGDFALKVETALSKGYQSWKHTIEPYLHTHFITSPKVPTDHHFIFSIDDGWDNLQLTRFGVRNSFFVKAPCGIERFFWIDLWANAFYDTPTIPTVIPKGYWNLEWHPFHRFFLASDGGWSFQRTKFDFYNTRLEWTLNEDAAFAVEYRHRSSYDWRKADFYNFILESVRTQQELHRSPLSNRRNTLLFRTFWRPIPNYFTKFDLRYGWNNKLAKEKQPGYFEYLVQVGTVLYQHWRFAFTYEKREADNRFSVSLRLDPGAPSKRSGCR